MDGLPELDDPRVLYGRNPGDDTGVYKISDEVALVQTVDFFTPIVDDPYLFGAIAAANALSDCFTMGAKVLTGLNIVGFPCASGMDQLSEILRGGGDKVIEAGGVIIGGHSVEDAEPKYGVAVTGIVHPDRLITNAGAKVGDALVLTKKIGTGIVCNVRKSTGTVGKIANALRSSAQISDAVYDEVIQSMQQLNRSASEVMAEVGVNACTDITGFGLLGHVSNVAEASGVGVKLWYSEIPKFDGVVECAIRGTRGGGERNWKFIRDSVSLDSGLSEDQVAVLYDAQTSGPLFISVPQEKKNLLLQKLRDRGLSDAREIGEVCPAFSGYSVRVES